MQDQGQHLAPLLAPADHILDWDPHQVHLLLNCLGFSQYEPQLLENDITGDVLIHMDHEALRDIGVNSVGQRLSILKAVYSVKVRDDVPIEDHHWSPPTDEMEQTILESPSGIISPRRMFEMLCERDDRIKFLENEIKRLSDSLSGFRDDIQAISKVLYSRDTLPDPYGRLGKASRSPTASNFPHPLSNAATNERLTGLGRSNSLQHPSTGQFFGNRIPSPGLANWHSSTENLSPLPSPSGSPATPSHLQHSTLQQQQQDTSLVTHSEVLSDHIIRTASSLASVQLTDSMVPMPFTPSGLPNSGSNPATPTHSSPISSQPVGLSRLTQSSNGQGQTSSPQWAFDSAQSRPGTAPIAPSSAITSGSLAPMSGSALHNLVTVSPSLPLTHPEKTGDPPPRSFKVTHEDPCYKVLPAALKKYKINDDWRDYALFICYGIASNGSGTTERCLSYDEKPLLLFQKLKEAGQNPVFMLRHIRDIKSPIVMAAAKHALRRDKRAKDKEKAEGGALATADEEKQRDRQSPHPYALPSPTTAPIKGYCISIYPYMSERADEFDVGVGDTFTILNKTKGWWVVYRQTEGIKLESGFVPAGCLLEISKTPVEIAATAKDSMNASSTNAALVPISPSSIVSVSTPGIALMDYKATGSDELALARGDLVRVYKRYNHWSYVLLSCLLSTLIPVARPSKKIQDCGAGCRVGLSANSPDRRSRPSRYRQ